VQVPCNCRILFISTSC